MEIIKNGFYAINVHYNFMKNYNKDDKDYKIKKNFF